MKQPCLAVLIIALVFLGKVFPQSSIVQKHFETGFESSMRGNFAEALANFQSALEKYQTEKNKQNKLLAKLNYNIGICLHRTGRFAEAVAYLETAVKLDKIYSRAFYALGMTHAALGENQAAIKNFRRAIRLDEKNGEIWFDSAMIYLRLNDLVNAHANFQKAISYRSIDAPTAYNNLGVISAMQGDWLQAEKFFQTALEMTAGKLPEARRNLEIVQTSSHGKEITARLSFSFSKNL